MYTLQELAQKAKATPASGRGAEAVVRTDAEIQPDIAVSPKSATQASRDKATMYNDDTAVQQGWVFPAIGVSTIINWLLRYWWLILLLAALGAAIGIGFGKTAKPRFNAGTDILVAPSNLQLVPNDVYVPSVQAESQLMDIESKLRLLTSGNVLQRVVDELKLQDDPEFNGTQTGLLSGILGGAKKNADSANPEQAKNIAALRELSSRIEARRPERSYLINLTVWAQEPEKAVLLANATAKAFQEEVAQNEQDGAARASRALTEPLNELKKAATEAEMKVAQFRNAQGLQTSNAGELVSTQSLTQINTQLVAALTRQAEAKSRYDELTSANNQALDPSSTLQSPTLTALRTQYATLKQRLDAMAMTYGSLYPELVSTQSQIAGLQTQIAQETSRILRAAKLDLDQANSVVETLRRQTEAARSAVSLDTDAQVTLNDLERDRLATTALYQTYLTRAQEIAQRQQIDATNIRIVSTALPPKSRSWPPGTAVLAVAGAVVGGGLGSALAMLLGFVGLMRAQRRAAYAVN
ncbi:GumC family protein [Pseudochrobactrum sp. sp1633]|uniref:GumC family protein n=1 Tax=Pseudochrobactrum sp. sp1633 TaxID=3036706 RepID=UPI0025A570E3|nr:GumC family protein [Pseudochrobactrum sp. sp1633]MDM8346472.1 GumC family protein [Pseudochrobactrum sp. sp1633]HWD12688.1 GumC family protein [Pseudochrobactrum sp.]